MKGCLHRVTVATGQRFAVLTHGQFETRRGAQRGLRFVARGGGNAVQMGQCVFFAVAAEGDQRRGIAHLRVFRCLGHAFVHHTAGQVRQAVAQVEASQVMAQPRVLALHGYAALQQAQGHGGPALGEFVVGGVAQGAGIDQVACRHLEALSLCLGFIQPGIGAAGGAGLAHAQCKTAAPGSGFGRVSSQHFGVQRVGRGGLSLLRTHAGQQHGGFGLIRGQR